MKFPITRESLQAFDYAKTQEALKEEELQRQIAQILDDLCKEFKQSMPSNCKEKKFVWKGLYTVRQLYITGFGPGGFNSSTMDQYKMTGLGQGRFNISNMDEYLPRFIEKLKELFIGCDIIMDPLKTYLIIDWS